MYQFSKTQPTKIVDGQHAGTTLWFDEQTESWWAANHEHMSLTELTGWIAIRSTLDGDEHGFNHNPVACDLDQNAGVWVIELDDESQVDDFYHEETTILAHSWLEVFEDLEKLAYFEAR